jgi:hypothetical protein
MAHDIPSNIEFETHDRLFADFRDYCDGQRPTVRLALLFALTIESHDQLADYGLAPGSSHSEIAAGLMRALGQ